MIPIRNRITSKMRKWRSKRRNPATSVHPDMSTYIHETLPKLEEWKRNGNAAASLRGGPGASDGMSALDILKAEMAESRRLGTILQTRKLHGAPINLPFTDVNEILKKVGLLLTQSTSSILSEICPFDNVG